MHGPKESNGVDESIDFEDVGAERPCILDHSLLLPLSFPAWHFPGALTLMLPSCRQPDGSSPAHGARSAQLGTQGLPLLPFLWHQSIARFFSHSQKTWGFRAPHRLPVWKAGCWFGIAPLALAKHSCCVSTTPQWPASHCSTSPTPLVTTRQGSSKMSPRSSTLRGLPLPQTLLCLASWCIPAPRPDPSQTSLLRKSSCLSLRGQLVLVA